MPVVPDAPGSSPSSPTSSTNDTTTTTAADAAATYSHSSSPPPKYTPPLHPERTQEPDAQAEAESNGQSSDLLPRSEPTRTPGASNNPPTPGGHQRRYRPAIMDNLFRFSLPSLPSSQAIRTAGVYVSGALFSLGFWFFIDASVYSKVNNPGDVHVKFVDWIPGICSALGMLVINSIEKSRLNGDSFSYSGSDVAWKARLVLFLGFALMAGGLAGSVAVLVLKYIVEQYEFETMYFGIANVVANSMIMLSSIVLWVSQNMEDDYTYRLSL